MNISSRYLLPLAYMTGLIFLSSIPGDSTPDSSVGSLFVWLPPKLQNLLHIPLYAGLFVCWWWALGERRSPSKSRFVIAVGVSLSWAVVDETWQSFVPGRYGSFADILLNMLGVSIAAYVAQKRHDASVRARSGCL